MNLLYISGALVLVLIVVFYFLVFSSADEIPPADAQPNHTDSSAQLTTTTAASSSQPQPSHTALDQLSNPSDLESSTSRQQPPNPQPEQSSSNSFIYILKRIGRFIYEVLIEFIVLGILRLIWFLIRGFFVFLGRIFD